MQTINVEYGRTAEHDSHAFLTPTRALAIVLGLGLFGTLFSGVLTYHEMFGATAMSCPAPGAAGTVLGYPACVYGFFMFALISVMAALGLRGARHVM